MKMLAYCIFLSSFVTAIMDIQPDIKLRNLERMEKSLKQCRKLSKAPFFESKLVTGKPWRIYYTWNMNIHSKCLNIVFQNATPAIIQRYRRDMSDYMQKQPFWDSASLLMTTVSGKARYEVLLIPTQGAEGEFNGVANLVRAGETPKRGGVPLKKYQLKLVRDGMYLVSMDCQTSLANLSARSKKPPFRAEVAAVAAELDIGDGFPACNRQRRKEEHFLI